MPSNIPLYLTRTQIDAKPSVPHGEGSQPPRSKKIFVGGLAPETDDGAGTGGGRDCVPVSPHCRSSSNPPAALAVPAAQLKSHFEQYGVVMEALVMVDHNSGRSRGFG